jgi:hypothetical protein
MRQRIAVHLSSVYVAKTLRLALYLSTVYLAQTFSVMISTDHIDSAWRETNRIFLPAPHKIRIPEQNTKPKRNYGEGTNSDMHQRVGRDP